MVLTHGVVGWFCDGRENPNREAASGRWMGKTVKYLYQLPIPQKGSPQPPDPFQTGGENLLWGLAALHRGQ